MLAAVAGSLGSLASVPTLAQALSTADFAHHSESLELTPAGQVLLESAVSEYRIAFERGERAEAAFLAWANAPQNLVALDDGVDPMFAADGRRFAARWRTEQRRLVDQYFATLREFCDPSIVGSLEREFLRKAFLAQEPSAQDQIPDLIALLDPSSISGSEALSHVIEQYAMDIDRLLRLAWRQPQQPSDTARNAIAEFIRSDDLPGLIEHFKQQIEDESRLHLATLRHVPRITTQLPADSARVFEEQAHRILYGAIYRTVGTDETDVDERDRRELQNAREQLIELRNEMMTVRGVDARARAQALRALNRPVEPEDPEAKYREALVRFRDAWRSRRESSWHPS
ncbi:MAG: hypothetical protein ACR2GY_14575 [Phycisphaerales bacterium]